MVRFLAVFLVACGAEIGEPPGPSSSDGKEDNGQTTPAPQTASDFIEEVAEQYCDECFRCQATYPGGANAFIRRFGNRDACEDDAEDTFEPELVEQGIRNGRIVYNANAARACLEGIQYEQSCSTFWTSQTNPRVPAVCGTVLLGTVSIGGACVTDYECAASNALCDPTTKRCR